MIDMQRRYTVAEYHHLIGTGAIPEGEPLELIHGRLVPKMPKNSPHVIGVTRAFGFFVRHLPAGWFYCAQDPITLSDSEPEPDGLVARGEVDDYNPGHPGPGDSALVVEVADSSLAYDRTTKMRLYAENRVARYWIVNLADRQVEEHTGPSGPCDAPAYTTVTLHRSGDVIAFDLGGAAFDVPVDELLPRP